MNPQRRRFTGRPMMCMCARLAMTALGCGEGVADNESHCVSCRQSSRCDLVAYSDWKQSHGQPRYASILYSTTHQIR